MGCPHCMSACTKQGEDFDKDNIMEFCQFLQSYGLSCFKYKRWRTDRTS